jgi:hypothetical protein
MAPYIPAAPAGKDPKQTVVAYAVPDTTPYEGVKEGDVVVYLYEGKSSYIHVVAKIDSGGFVMSGLHNPLSESWARVTKETFICRVKAVYVWPEK